MLTMPGYWKWSFHATSLLNIGGQGRREGCKTLSGPEFEKNPDMVLHTPKILGGPFHLTLIDIRCIPLFARDVYAIVK